MEQVQLSRELNAVITRRVDVAPGLWIIAVTPEGWKLDDFDAGQYTTLGLPAPVGSRDSRVAATNLPPRVRLVRRDYSIASSPKQRDHLEFYLVRVEDGGLTPRLFELGEGDPLWLGKKIAGTFVLSRAPDDAQLVFMATGTGVAPFMSMLRTVLVPDMRRRIALLHGVRHRTDLGYDEELRAMEERCPSFSYLPVISRPHEEKTPWRGRTGYVQDIWQSRDIESLWGARPTPDDTHVFLCGGPGMIDDTIARLRGEGFVEHTARTPGQIHTERYW